MVYNLSRGWEPLFPVGDSQCSPQYYMCLRELEARIVKQGVGEGSLPPFIKIKPKLTWLGFFFVYTG